jgi:hypothetical protein
MNNLDKLWAYIKEKAPPGGIAADDDRQYRDLRQYYEKKVSVWNKTPRELEKVRDLVAAPLKVCRVRPDGNELSLPSLSNKLAVAANLLAMSIVQNITDEGALTRKGRFWNAVRLVTSRRR